MKILANGILCLFLLTCAPGWAQEAPGDAPATPADGGTAGPQTPPQQPPAAEQPVERSPGQTGPVVVAPPELPKYPDVRMPGESGGWAGFYLWAPQEQPIFNKGNGSNYTQSSYVVMAGTPKFAYGAEIGIAIGLHNSLTLSGFNMRAAGDITAPVPLTLWNSNYTAGWLVSTDYQLRDIKLSFAYLTWPYPVESRRFRLRTLWQVHYVSIRSGFDAPTQPLFDANGNPLVDADGNPITYTGEGTKWFISPALGIGITEYVSPRLRLEFNGSGFTVPHHFTLADGDASISYRFGKFEVSAGGKLFHFETSTDATYYMKGTMASAFIGARWYTK